MEEAVFVNRIPGIDAREALFSLPLVGSEASVLALEVDANETSGGVGVFRKVPSDVDFSAASTPPPDRRFATATLPTRSAGEGSRVDLFAW
jgi:hypothetical protein